MGRSDGEKGVGRVREYHGEIDGGSKRELWREGDRERDNKE